MDGCSSHSPALNVAMQDTCAPCTHELTRLLLLLLLPGSGRLRTGLGGWGMGEPGRQ